MPSVGNQKRVFFLRPLDWLLRQGTVFPIAQCKGIRIPEWRKISCGKQNEFLALESAMQLKES